MNNEPTSQTTIREGCQIPNACQYPGCICRPETHKPVSSTTEFAEPFTKAEAHFWSVMNEADELTRFYPDEPDVNFIPRALWRQAMWKAVQAIRREDAARGGWPESLYQELQQS